jgi:hypothetical protein
LSKGLSFFSSETWRHFTFTFCRYLKSEYEGIYHLQVLSIRIWLYLSSASKYPQILSAITVYFQTKFFPYNLMNFHTIVCAFNRGKKVFENCSTFFLLMLFRTKLRNSCTIGQFAKRFTTCQIDHRSKLLYALIC